MIRFSLPIRVESELNRRDHHHERAARFKRAHEAVGYALTPRHVRPVLRITLVRVAHKELDSDAVPGAMKAVRDAIAKQLHLDDRSGLIDWVYGQASAPVGFYEVRAAIDPLPPSDWSTPRPRSEIEEPAVGLNAPRKRRVKSKASNQVKAFTAQPEETLAERYARLAKPAVYRPGGAR